MNFKRKALSMAVYVDKPIWKFKNMIMCHMFADTLDELHAMADKIGLKRSWFQDKRTPHYDLSKSKRALAVKHGAIEINLKDDLNFRRLCRQIKKLPEERHPEFQTFMEQES